jgi:D-arabinose 1-dehydrogenase-like Zn-dependent alcohol dehydrogenase
VHGCGGVGLSAVQIAHSMDAFVVATDVDDAKLQKAQQEGAIVTLNVKDMKPQEVAEAIKERTHGGVHASIDALGRSFTAQSSINCLRKAGRHVQVGLTTQEEQGMVSLPLDVLVNKEWQIVGNLGNPHVHYPELIALIAQGKLKPRSLVTRQIGFQEVTSVLQNMTNFNTVGFNVITNFT